VGHFFRTAGRKNDPQRVENHQQAKILHLCCGSVFRSASEKPNRKTEKVPLRNYHLRIRNRAEPTCYNASRLCLFYEIATFIAWGTPAIAVTGDLAAAASARALQSGQGEA